MVSTKIKIKNNFIFSAVVLVISSLLLSSCTFRDELPVKRYICGKGFVNCLLVSRYDDMVSCEIADRMSGWECDKTDKNNIVCQDVESDVSDSYCTK
ncbi:hypothetical protein KKA15_01810 [Patescibacteria group bacterium]|nr:hypothetical protein [Patescibacteria group bacterium]